MAADKVRIQTHMDLSLIEVKSQFLSEYRRFSLSRSGTTFEDFESLLQTLHGIGESLISIWYQVPASQDILPINNNDNFQHALNTVNSILRLLVHYRGSNIGDAYYGKKTLGTGAAGALSSSRRLRIDIGEPLDFRRVSSLLDVDKLPDTVRRVKLCKHESDKPLGFYIRSGSTVRMTDLGVEKVPGIFISRLRKGGLAASTGLLAVGDEVLEVNGIDVTGKNIDQVTDMMIANSHNLIVTIKPVRVATLGMTSYVSQTSVTSELSQTQADLRQSDSKRNNRSGVLSNMTDLPDSDEDAVVVTDQGIIHI